MKIFETNYWIIELNKDQAYLGRCRVILRRECGDLAYLKEEEISDLFNVIRKLEAAIKKSFNATMFNWTCLMNDAYQSENPEPQVHWHFRPRYKHKVKFEGITFEDIEFGHHYNRERKLNLEKEMLIKIIKKIQENLN